MRLFLQKVSRFLFIAGAVISLLFASYFYFDPFKVIRSYNDYSYPTVALNRDYISCEMFIKNHKKYNYNSFILGSSRTLAFKPISWSSYLPNSASPFLLDASGESIYGIYKKIKYLDSTNVSINNALIIIDRDGTFQNTTNPRGHLGIKHPSFSGESPYKFQSVFFKAYLNPRFLFNFYYFNIFKKYKSFMKGYIEPRKIKYDTITNELSIIDQEIELAENPNLYYEKRKKQFYKRDGEKIDPFERINNTSLAMLLEIKHILEKQNCNYKFVISPLYEQVKFNKKDLIVLHNLFGENLHDFSGKNEFTNAKTNYYEKSHFRPKVGNKILELVYSSGVTRQK